MNPSATSPLLVYPSLDPAGSVRWHLRHGDAAATLDTASGEVFRNAGAMGSGSVAFQTVVGALEEYYRTDAEEYDGLNVKRMRSELARRRSA